MIKRFYEKHRDMIPYAVFGVLTTLVNIAAYWALAHPLGMAAVPSDVIAWALAVLFAYVTNRKWVFHSEAATGREILKEGASFYLCRLATGALDWGSIFLLVDVLHWNDMIVKIAVNIVVILLNYAASRVIVFRKRRNGVK